jgi:hypothetical protein
VISLFTFLWALAVVIHQVSERQIDAWHDLLLVAVAVAAMLRPSSLARLTAVAIAHLAEVAIELPQVSNHWLLMGLGDISILIVLATRPVPRPDGTWDRAALYRALAPPLRLMLIAFYTFVFLAKLNHAFLDPDLSCAVVMYERLALRTSLPLGDWTRLPAIWFTVIVEGLLPLLLTIRGTRVSGVLVAFVFHLFMGLAGYYDFSSAAAAFLVLFLPDDMSWRLARLTERHSWLRRCTWTCQRLARNRFALPVVLVSGYALLLQVPRFESFFTFTLRIWFVLAIAGLVAGLLAIRETPAAERIASSPQLAVIRPLHLAGLLLVLLNGLSPYIGLKTEHSFTMFSNLMTEGESGNHLFMPRAMRVFPLQDDIVRIVDSSSSRLSDYIFRRRRIVFYMFHRLVRTDPSMSVAYEVRGQRYDVPRVEDHPVLGREIHPLVGKILHFRVVRPICAH